MYLQECYFMLTFLNNFASGFCLLMDRTGNLFVHNRVCGNWDAPG